LQAVIFAKRTQFVVVFSGAYPSGVAAAIGLRTKALSIMERIDGNRKANRG
jgi:hypothetical protein